MKKYKKIYFMGIKGVGMAPLAIIAKEAGFEVSGSDLEEKFITDSILENSGIKFFIGFSESNVVNFFEGVDSTKCLFIATGAHGGFDNVEAKYAKSKDIEVISHGQAVGMFMNGAIFDRSDIEGISVCGAHGKTTTAGILAACLSSVGYDPSYTVGTSEIKNVGPSGHYGKGKFFIAEADEYLSEPTYDRTPKFLYQHPKCMIINNIDFDHPDFFPTIEDIEKAYIKFADNLDEDGILIANGDDPIVSKIAKNLVGRNVVTFGTGEGNDYIITRFNQEEFTSYFSVEARGMNLGKFMIQVPGYHNAKNATAAIAALVELGVPLNKIEKGIASYEGVKRRLEKIGTTSLNQIILDDYAHHPEEIKKTLAAIKLAYPNKKIITIFQPHTASRTNALLSDFTSAFSDADELILTPTFASARNDENPQKDTILKDEFDKMNRKCVYLENHSDVVEYILKTEKSKDSVIVTLGAGDVYKIAYLLEGK